MNTKKVLELFESEYTEEVYDRKMRFVEKLCEERPEGFFYDELADLIKIANYTIRDYLSLNMEMRKALIELLETLKRGFNRRKSFDHIIHYSNLPSLLNCFIGLIYNASIPDHVISNLQIEEEAGDVHPDNDLEVKLCFLEWLFMFVSEEIEDIKKKEENFEETKANEKNSRLLGTNKKGLMKKTGTNGKHSKKNLEPLREKGTGAKTRETSDEIGDPEESKPGIKEKATTPSDISPLL